jgi:hypothetical protein
MSYELKYLKYKNKYFALKNMIQYGGITEKEKLELQTEVSFLVKLLEDQRKKEELLLENNIVKLTTELTTTGINYGQARMILKDSIYDFYTIMNIFKKLAYIHANYTIYTKKEYLDILHNITSGVRTIDFYRITPEQEALAKNLIDKIGIDADIARMIITSKLKLINKLSIENIKHLFETYKSIQDVLVPGDGRKYNYNKKEYSTIIYYILHSCSIEYQATCSLAFSEDVFIILLKKIFSNINLNNKIYTLHNFYEKLIKLISVKGPYLLEAFVTFLQDVDYKIYDNPKYILKLLDVVSSIFDKKSLQIFERSNSYDTMDEKKKVLDKLVADIGEDIKDKLPKYITSLKQTPKK